MTDKDNKEDRQRYVSVAVSFGDLEMLQRHGSGVAELTCPECGARGKRLGNPGEDFRFEGFEPLTAGGLLYIQCECQACKASVTLPHRRA
jgi:hypothetical protein